jgi:ADP-ribose pyrophosphatase
VVDRDGRTHRFVRLVVPDWVAVVAVTPDDRWLLVEQERFGSGRSSLEPVGGVVERGESPEDTARRELLEETGHACASLCALGVVRPNPTLQSNRCFLFLASGAVPVAAPRPDPAERLTLRALTRGEVAAAVRDGTVDAALGVLALERALHRG